MEVDLSVNGGVLVIGDDFCCVGDLAADEVFDGLVGVETGAALSDLSDPGPHILRGGIDGDAQRVRPLGFAHQFVAR